jgi:hypothetical protein
LSIAGNCAAEQAYGAGGIPMVLRESVEKHLLPEPKSVDWTLQSAEKMLEVISK